MFSGYAFVACITSFYQNMQIDVSRTMSCLHMNANRSHSKVAMKQFLRDVLTSIESTEDELTCKLHEKLLSLSIMQEDMVTKCLKKLTLPHVSGYAVLKLL